MFPKIQGLPNRIPTISRLFFPLTKKSGSLPRFRRFSGFGELDRALRRSRFQRDPAGMPLPKSSIQRINLLSNSTLVGLRNCESSAEAIHCSPCQKNLLPPRRDCFVPLGRGRRRPSSGDRHRFRRFIRSRNWRRKTCRFSAWRAVWILGGCCFALFPSPTPRSGALSEIELRLLRKATAGSRPSWGWVEFWIIRGASWPRGTIFFRIFVSRASHQASGIDSAALPSLLAPPRPRTSPANEMRFWAQRGMTASSS